MTSWKCEDDGYADMQGEGAKNGSLLPSLWVWREKEKKMEDDDELGLVLGEWVRNE